MALNTYAAANQPPTVPFASEPLLGINLQSVFVPAVNPNTGLPYPDTITAPHYLGQTVMGTGDSEWVYCFSPTSLAAGGVTLDQYFQATTGGSSASIPAAVTVPTGGVGAFFWAQKAGSGYGQTE